MPTFLQISYTFYFLYSFVPSLFVAKATQAASQTELSTLKAQENETAAALAAELARLPSETEAIRAEVHAAAAANAATQQHVQDLAAALATAQAELVAQQSKSATLAPKVLEFVRQTQIFK